MLYKSIIVLLCLFTIKEDIANAVTVQQVPITPKTIAQIIDEKALQYGVSAERVHHIIKKESQYNPKAVGDMNLICERTGLPVRARGILQITECYYPDVSDECAFDAQCSLDRMLPLMRDEKTCLSQWSTCTKELLEKTR